MPYESPPRLLQPPRKRGRWLGLGSKAMPAFLLSGAFLGMAGGISFDTALGHTSTTEFCLSCHEMRTLQEELSRTAHFQNPSGVRVGCGDCHVPREQPGKLVAKFLALDDIYAHFTGVIATPERFEARRLAMAEKVWAEMKVNGSQACRNCHSFTAMALDAQSDRPRRKHAQAIESGETCIDCHKGIVHALPAEFLADDR